MDGRPLIVSSRLDRCGRYSPDGNTIAFASLRSGHWQLWTSDREGGNTRQLTAFERGEVGQAYWTPDSRQIVFASNGEGSEDLYVISATGGKPRKLGPSDKELAMAGRVLSPDGTRQYSAQNGGIWSSKLDGEQETEVLKFDGQVSSLQVTPQGLYFVTNFTTTKSGDLMFYRFPSGPLTKVSGVESPSQYGLSISPDGHWLLYSKMTSQGSDLMLVEDFK